MPFRGQASWAKMTSPGGKLTALASHLTIKVNKAEELTYLSTNIGTFWYNTKLWQYDTKTIKYRKITATNYSANMPRHAFVVPYNATCGLYYKHFRINIWQLSWVMPVLWMCLRLSLSKYTCFKLWHHIQSSFWWL